MRTHFGESVEVTHITISPGVRPPDHHRPRFSGVRRARIAVALALALSVGLAGQEMAWSQSGTPESSPAASPTAVVTPAPDAPRLVLELDPLNDSGLSGTATLYESGDQTIVDLAVKNTGNDQPAHIHAGQCGSLTAEPAYDLSSLHADGTSRTVIDTPLEGLLNGQFAIDIHLSPTELGTLSACANIEGTPTVPSEATPAATATPSAEATGVGGDTTPTATTTAAAPTVASTETPVATATTAATKETTATATTTVAASTSSGSDGTGGNTGSTTTTTNGTSSTGTTTGSSTTGTTSGTTSDGTGSGASTSNGSTYLATDGTVKTADMAASGTGPLAIVPEHMDPTIFWSILSAAILLFASSVWIWLGERRASHSHRQPPRWSRLGM